MRYLTMFISGEFSLEEANDFAIEAFDNTVVPKMRDFFENSIEVSSVAFSVSGVPPRLGYLIDNYSTVDFVDEYTFHLMKHIVDSFFQVTDEEKKDLRRMKQRRREKQRLGLPFEDESYAVRGVSPIEIHEL